MKISESESTSPSYEEQRERKAELLIVNLSGSFLYGEREGEEVLIKLPMGGNYCLVSFLIMWLLIHVCIMYGM